MATGGQFDLDAALPGAGSATGLNKDGHTLYVTPSKPSAIWIQRPNQCVERWARLGPDEGCA